MKGTFILLFFMSFALGINAQVLVITGKIKVTEPTTIVLTDGINADTVVTSTGDFYFKRPGRGMLLSIQIFDKAGSLRSRKEFFAQNGKVRIDIGLNAHLSDSSLQLKYDAFNNRYNLLVQLKQDLTRYYFSSKKTDEEKYLFDSAYNDLHSITVSFIESYIEENRGNLLGPYICAGYFLDGADTATILRAYSLLNKDLYDSSFALQMVKKRVDLLDQLSPGKPAPTFATVSDKGQPISSERLKGKYAVLDYWGSWCGPCLLGMPRMKQYYEKYKAKVEFVGISCRENKQTWLESLKKYALPWPQVLNPESREGLEKLYGVVRFPTKVLVDPEGKLVGIYNGETDEFYSALDQLFKGSTTASGQ